MTPRKVFATMADFQIYRLLQIWEKEEKAKANKKKWAQELQRMREEKMPKGPPAVEAEKVGPRRANSHISVRTGVLSCHSKETQSHGEDKSKDKNKDQDNKKSDLSIANNVKAANGRLVDMKAQNKKKETIMKATGNTTVAANRVYSNEISHQSRLELQFSSIMPRTWGRSGGTARLPEPCQIMPHIRKARQVDIAEEDFGVSEKDAAIHAPIRPLDMELKRKGEAEEDFGVSEKDAAIHAPIRPLDMGLKRKREAEAKPPAQQHRSIRKTRKNAIAEEDFGFTEEDAEISAPMRTSRDGADAPARGRKDFSCAAASRIASELSGSERPASRCGPAGSSSASFTSTRIGFAARNPPRGSPRGPAQ